MRFVMRRSRRTEYSRPIRWARQQQSSRSDGRYEPAYAVSSHRVCFSVPGLLAVGAARRDCRTENRGRLLPVYELAVAASGHPEMGPLRPELPISGMSRRPPIERIPRRLGDPRRADQYGLTSTTSSPIQSLSCANRRRNASISLRPNTSAAVFAAPNPPVLFGTIP